MSKTLVRSLIAGSVSAVASLSLFAATNTAHAGGSDCTPIYVDNGDGTASVHYPDFCADDTPTTVPPSIDIHLLPINVNLFPPITIDQPPVTLVEPPVSIDLPPAVVCDPLDLDNLEVRAAQTSPDNWQWRFWINGPTKYLCDDNLDAVMIDTGTGTPVELDFTVFNIVDVNNEGDDFVAEFNTPCTYSTLVHFGEAHTVLDSYLDQSKNTDECLIPLVPLTPGTDGGDIPTDSVPVPDDTVPTDTVPTETVPTPPSIDQGGPTTTVPGRQLPHTGGGSTLVIGAGMVVLGLGLGFTAMSMTRRRRSV